jgi:hypothetical protein
MKTFTHYQCDICGNKYLDESLARACEASRPVPVFITGQGVYCEHFPRQGNGVNTRVAPKIGGIKLASRLGHYYQVGDAVELEDVGHEVLYDVQCSSCKDYGGWRSARDIESAEVPPRDAAVLADVHARLGQLVLDGAAPEIADVELSKISLYELIAEDKYEILERPEKSGRYDIKLRLPRDGGGR